MFWDAELKLMEPSNAMLAELTSTSVTQKINTVPRVGWVGQNNHAARSSLLARRPVATRINETPNADQGPT